MAAAAPSAGEEMTTGELTELELLAEIAASKARQAQEAQLQAELEAKLEARSGPQATVVRLYRHFMNGFHLDFYIFPTPCSHSPPKSVRSISALLMIQQRAWPLISTTISICCAT